MSGGTLGAEQGTLAIMVGGKPANFSRAEAIFQGLWSRHPCWPDWRGPVGQVGEPDDCGHHHRRGGRGAVAVRKRAAPTWPRSKRLFLAVLPTVASCKYTVNAWWSATTGGSKHRMLGRRDAKRFVEVSQPLVVAASRLLPQEAYPHLQGALSLGRLPGWRAQRRHAPIAPRQHQGVVPERRKRRIAVLASIAQRPHALREPSSKPTATPCTGGQARHRGIPGKKAARSVGACGGRCLPA